MLGSLGPSNSSQLLGFGSSSPQGNKHRIRPKSNLGIKGCPFWFDGVCKLNPKKGNEGLLWVLDKLYAYGLEFRLEGLGRQVLRIGS